MSVRTLFKPEPKQSSSKHKCALPFLWKQEGNFPYGTIVQCERCNSVYIVEDSLGMFPYWQRLRGIKLRWCLRKMSQTEKEKGESQNDSDGLRTI